MGSFRRCAARRAISPALVKTAGAQSGRVQGHGNNGVRFREFPAETVKNGGKQSKAGAVFREFGAVQGLAQGAFKHAMETEVCPGRRFVQASAAGSTGGMRVSREFPAVRAVSGIPAGHGGPACGAGRRQRAGVIRRKDAVTDGAAALDKTQHASRPPENP